jgi:selenocysteine lyase/cysteine desulfurase
MLPDRAAEAEDDYVAALAARDTSDEVLADLVTEAMEARRPRLAARLVGLLSDRVEVEAGSPLARAQRVARLVLMQGGVTPEDLYNELDEAWTAARRRRMTRIKQRMRDALNGNGERQSRLSKRRRR